jgi:hypothetical protein
VSNIIKPEFQKEAITKLVTLVNSEYEAAPAFKSILDNQKTLASAILVLLDVVTARVK